MRFKYCIYPVRGLRFVWDVLIAVHHEAVLFAALGFIVGGIDDLLVDMIWIARSAWRRITIYRWHARADAQTLAQPAQPGKLAVFIAAWQEDAVIGAMLDHALKSWGGDGYRIYVGVYPNDPATQLAVAPYVGDRVRMVVNARPGPTTKADCLNAVWRAMLADERGIM